MCVCVCMQKRKKNSPTKTHIKFIFVLETIAAFILHTFAI